MKTRLSTSAFFYPYLNTLQPAAAEEEEAEPAEEEPESVVEEPAAEEPAKEATPEPAAAPADEPDAAPAADDDQGPEVHHHLSVSCCGTPSFVRLSFCPSLAEGEENEGQGVTKDAPRSLFFVRPTRKTPTYASDSS